jgi:heme/copper-type cytochrome/quinol oxidase subunit 3
MTAQDAAIRARRRQAAPNGIWGMALFLCAEVTLFGTFIGSYFYLDFNSHQWPPPGIKPPEVVLPLVATGWILLTLVPMWLSSLSARNGAREKAIAWLALALVTQAGYLAFQILLFRHDYNDFRPQGSAYGSIYFTLLAAHHAHVLLGLLLNAAVMWRLTFSGLTNYWLIGVRGLAIYWYVVGGLAIAVTLTQLSPSL